MPAHVPKIGIAEGAILRLEMDVFPDGQITLRTLCAADADFEAVTNAFRAAVKDLGFQIKTRSRCPFHPDHPDNPMRTKEAS